MQLQIFDVEHGCCALLTCDNGMRMMIDCGNNATSGWYPGDFLASHGIQYLDMLVLTNYDQDHLSGFPNLVNRVTIGHIVRNTSVSPGVLWALKTKAGTPTEAMRVFVDAIANRFSLPGTRPALLFPGVDWSVHMNAYPIFEDENNLSLLLRLRIGNVTFLFPGDLEFEGWKFLLARDQLFSGIVPSITVLMASHHGRANGVCSELFDQYGCNPELIVISDDYLQHATQETTDYYRSKCKGIQGFRGQGARWVLSTRSDGSLTFWWEGNTCQVY